MTQRLDDAELAKDDVISRPEVSPGEVQAARKKPKKGQPAATGPAELEEEDAGDPEREERGARLLSKQFTAQFETLTGEKVDDDQLEALTEISLLVFKGLRGIRAGRFIGTGIMAVCLVLPFMPPLYRLLRGAKKKEEEKANV